MILRKAKTPPQRLFVEEPSDNPLWQLMHKISDKHYPSVRQLMIDTWDAWRSGIDASAVFDALMAGNTALAMSIVERAWMAAENELVVQAGTMINSIVVESLSEAGPRIAAQMDVTFATGQITPEVRSWVQTRVGDLITQIGETERQAIRQTILDGMQAGRGPVAIARDVRQFIGLTRPQQKTIERLRETMTAAGTRGDLIENAIDKRVKKMIRQRAQVIARNETILASKEGHRQAYLDAAHQGAIDINRARRYWVITPLDACEICLPIPGMNPDGVGLDEPFRTPIGPLIHVHAHVQCRCVETLSHG